MIEIILNEKVHAEYVIENNLIGSKPRNTLGIIAKYYYSIGYKKPEIRGLLEDFLLKCDPNTNIVKWQRLIDERANSADKYPLIEIDSITITEDEMKKIQTIGGIMLQRLMFTMLCLAKFKDIINPNNHHWVSVKDAHIFSLANITTTYNRQGLMFNDLWNLEYIGYSNSVDNINVYVKIINNSSPPALVVSDFRNLGNQYRRYCGEKYFDCENCGIVTKKNANPQRYCPDCSTKINRQKAYESWRESTLK